MMMYPISIQTRLAFSLAACSVVCVSLCHQAGLIPDLRTSRLTHRAQLCETLATTLTLSPVWRGVDKLEQHLEMFRRRVPDVGTAGLRTSSGDLISQIGGHQQAWTAAAKERADTCYIVPVFRNQQLWGRLEVQFNTDRGWYWLGRLPSWCGVAVVLGGGVFLLSRYTLGRALRDLDPSRVVPMRVRETLDSFAEGVLLIDPEDRIVLANRPFADALGVQVQELTGRHASDFAWQAEPVEGDTTLPWREVSQRNARVQNASLRIEVGPSVQHFSVNAVPVHDDEGGYRGSLVAFADVTSLEEKKHLLAETLKELHHSHSEVTRKNQELEFLARRDPLTGCLNRRSLFERFSTEWDQAMHDRAPLACVMVDIDNFKLINDNHGHQMGDKVLRATGEALQSIAGENDLPARYGGEEFCLVLPGSNLTKAHRMAEKVRAKLGALQFSGFSVTASLGVSSTEMGPADPQGLIDQADRCLYKAKRQGRNQTVCFDATNPKEVVIESEPSQARRPESPAGSADSAESSSRVATPTSPQAFQDSEAAAFSTRGAYRATLTSPSPDTPTLL